MTPRAPRQGFTLVEILVATSVLLLIGGVAAAFVVQGFRLWEHGAVRLRRLAADDDWTAQLGRDFSCALAGRGFTGDRHGCAFRTALATGADADATADVAYELAEGSLLRRATPQPGGAEAVLRFAPVRGARLAYAGADDAPEAWRDAWSSPTSAPARVRCSRAGPDGTPADSLLLRRTP